MYKNKIIKFNYSIILIINLINLSEYWSGGTQLIPDPYTTLLVTNSKFFTKPNSVKLSIIPIIYDYYISLSPRRILFLFINYYFYSS